MRKLVLYSEQMLPETEAIDQRLLALMGKAKPRIGFIPSVGDPDGKYYRDRQAYYAQYGADLCECLNLDRGYNPKQVQALMACDAIHLSGGNTFYFLYCLQVRGLLTSLRKYVARGGMLVGVSAGAILMTPDVSTAMLCDDTLIEELEDYSGLGLVEFAFVPHFGETNATVSDLKTYSKRNNITAYGCPDGAGIVVDGHRIECIGDILVVESGQEIRTGRA